MSVYVDAWMIVHCVHCVVLLIMHSCFHAILRLVAVIVLSRILYEFPIFDSSKSLSWTVPSIDVTHICTTHIQFVCSFFLAPAPMCVITNHPVGCRGGSESLSGKSAAMHLSDITGYTILTRRRRGELTSSRLQCDRLVKLRPSGSVSI